MELMVDLETLDTTRTSLVLSVGLMTFDRYGRAHDEVTLYPSFVEQRTLGRSVTLDTLTFWMEEASKGPAWREAFVPEGQRIPLVQVGNKIEHTAYRTWLAEDKVSVEGVTEVWANGDLFDLGILQSLYGMGPWKYNAPRDLRTLAREAQRYGWTYPEPRPDHRQHSAISDCRYQVDTLMSIRAFFRALLPLGDVL